MEEATITVKPATDSNVRRELARTRIDLARLYAKDALQWLDCSELREQHVAVGNAVALLDDALEGVRR